MSWLYVIYSWGGRDSDQLEYSDNVATLRFWDFPESPKHITYIMPLTEHICL